MMRRLLPLLALAACSRAPTEPVSTSTPSASASPAAPPAVAPTAAGTAFVEPREFPLLWDDPPKFVRTRPKSPARAAEYVISKVGADPEDAECVVMTFGARQGGSVEDNAKRWFDQFQPALPKPRRTSLDINGMHATLVEVAGTFAGNMMPNAQGQVTPTSKPGWRLIGAILESPSGLWFFKMTGPDLTVRSAAQGFEDMVRSARPR